MAAFTFAHSASGSTASGTSVSAVWDSTPAAGTLLIAFLGLKDAGPASWPSGWSQVEDRLAAPNQLRYQEVRMKVAGASESGTVSVTWDDAAAAGLIIVAYTVTSGFTPFVVGAGQTNDYLASGSWAPGPNLPDTGEPALMFLAVSNIDGTNLVPGAMTQRETLTVGGTTWKFADEIAASASPPYTYPFTNGGSGPSHEYVVILGTFGLPEVEVEPGVWMDWDGDGFNDSAVADADARLARSLPQGSATVSDNVTEYVLGSTKPITGNRPGSPNHIDQPGPETYTFYLKNTDGRFTPDNTSSPLYGKIKPGIPVWGGVNADGTLSGTGQTVYGFMAGYVRSFAPAVVAGSDAPWVAVLVDGPMAQWRRRRARVDLEEGRSYAEYRGAILDSIGETDTRRDLGYEADILAFSGNAMNRRGGRVAPITVGSTNGTFPTIPQTDFRQIESRTDPVALLESLNLATGARHFIRPANSKETWYQYVTVPRTHKLGTVSDDAWNGDNIFSMNGYEVSDDGKANVQEVTFSAIRGSITPSEVWRYGDVPFALSNANPPTPIIADFGDYVADATLDVASNGSSVSSSFTNYGTGAVILLSSSGASQITSLTVSGRRIARDSAQVIEGRASGVTVATERVASAISTEYLQSRGLAQGRADFTVWKFQRALARPEAGFSAKPSNLATVLPRTHYDVIDLTVDGLSMTDKRHEITSIDFRVSLAASSSVSDWSFTFGLQETPNPAPLSLFTIGESELGGTDILAP